VLIYLSIIPIEDLDSLSSRFSRRAARPLLPEVSIVSVLVGSGFNTLFNELTMISIGLTFSSVAPHLS
jgi:hypothetical protein